MSQNRKFEITDARGGAAFTVRVVTRAANTELVGTQEDGTLKIRLVSSPAGDPSTNQELITFLSEQLGVSVDLCPHIRREGAEGRPVQIPGFAVE